MRLELECLQVRDFLKSEIPASQLPWEVMKNAHHRLYLATSVGLAAAHLTGVPSVLGRAGAVLNRVGRTTRPRVTGLLQAHLPEAESLALGEVQGSDPQANQARQNPHQFLSRDGPVGDGMAPVSLQITDWLFADTYRGKKEQS